MYLPISVFPVPGGPKRRIPLGGPLKPLKISLRERERGGWGEREEGGGREREREEGGGGEDKQ